MRVACRVPSWIVRSHDVSACCYQTMEPLHVFIRYIVPAIPTLVAGIALLALLPRGNHAKVEEPETSSKAAADVPAGKDGEWRAFRCRCI